MKKLIILCFTLFLLCPKTFADTNNDPCAAIEDSGQRDFCYQLGQKAAQAKAREDEEKILEQQAQARDAAQNTPPETPVFKMQQPTVPKLLTPQLVGPTPQSPDSGNNVILPIPPPQSVAPSGANNTPSANLPLVTNGSAPDKQTTPPAAVPQRPRSIYQ